MNKKILVTGSNGQLATCIKHLDDNRFDFLYTSFSELDITNKQEIERFFGKHKIDWCINCAAYTAVDKAESDYESAYNVNAIGPKNLAELCNEYQVKLIHISTDFVFDGLHNKPYKETDKTSPASIYGETKLRGENGIVNILKEHFVIRTSWLYSEFGNNFLNTMLRLSKSKNQLGIVGDQIGTPTYAVDLAETILHIIHNNLSNYGIYHYSNSGVASWYDFAKAIFEISKLDIMVDNISTEEYPTPAKRPHFSVLDKSKTKKHLGVNIPYWRDSLMKAIENLENGQ